MRALYHFTTSPFSRRTRLALVHKRIEVELKDARANPSDGAKARELWPLRTVPVLVDGERTIGDSTAISHYLDQAYLRRPLWPNDHRAFVVAALVDGFLNTVVDVATRYFTLSKDPGWPYVKDEMLGRAMDAANALAKMTTSEHTTNAGWSAPDMWLYTMVEWFEGLPRRTNPTQNVKQILSLGLSLPPALAEWSKHHASREDVRTICVPA